jgi:hypothetical protein
MFHGAPLLALDWRKPLAQVKGGPLITAENSTALLVGRLLWFFASPLERATGRTWAQKGMSVGEGATASGNTVSKQPLTPNRIVLLHCCGFQGV